MQQTAGMLKQEPREHDRTRPGLALGATLLVQILASLVLAAPAVLAPVVAPMLGIAPTRVGLFVGALYLAAMLSGLWSGQGVARIGAVRLSQVAMLAVFAEIVRTRGSYDLGFLLLAALPALAGVWMLATQAPTLRPARSAAPGRE